MTSRETTVYASAARTATPAAATFATGYARGVALVVDVTAIGAAPSITVKLEHQDVASGKWVTLLTSAAIAAVSTTVLKVYPDLTAVANLTVNDVVWETCRVTVTHGNSDSITYSVSAHLVQ